MVYVRLTGILLLAHICAKFIAIYYIKIVHQRTQPHMVQWSITASNEAIPTNGSGFESGDSQLEFEVRDVLIDLFCESSYVVLGPYLLCSFCGRVAVRQPGPWRRKQHFEANNFPFQVNEGVLECPRPLVLIP